MSREVSKPGSIQYGATARGRVNHIYREEEDLSLCGVELIQGPTDETALMLCERCRLAALAEPVTPHGVGDLHDAPASEEELPSSLPLGLTQSRHKDILSNVSNRTIKGDWRNLIDTHG